MTKIVDINDCKEQGYDWAAAVSGSKNYMAAHIINKNPKAMYIHCFSHRLNLSICKTFKKQSVSNVMEHIKELSYFFKFLQPRQLLSLECIELCTPNADKKIEGYLSNSLDWMCKWHGYIWRVFYSHSPLIRKNEI